MKRELRHSWLSNGRRESVAEHTWRMAMMAIVLIPQLDEQINLERLLEMILIHDLPEVYVGDRPVFKKQQGNKYLLEKKALEKMTKNLPIQTGKHLLDIWLEFEVNVTLEAKIAHALDKMEVIIQHNQADIKTWTKIEQTPAYSTEYGNVQCDFNKVFKELRSLIRQDTAKKLNPKL